MTNPVKMTGLDTAPSIAVGAIVTDAAWHLAEHYGPSIETYPTERDAIAAGLADYDTREAARAAEWERTRSFGMGSPIPFRLTVDLRWTMAWDQGEPDANGRRTVSSGMTFTVRRTTYDTPTDAREHLARIDKYAGV